MKDAIDLAIAQLGNDGRRLSMWSNEWSPKIKKFWRKKAAQSMRISLRSAHRFSVTEDMQRFCNELAFRLRETELEALIENATPPFECAVFENMPNTDSGFLVVRARWDPVDMWFPRWEALKAHVYDQPGAFMRYSSDEEARRREEAMGKQGVPNSADHPVYYVRKFWLDSVKKPTGLRGLNVDPFGFYFCPTGFLWREPKEPSPTPDTMYQYLRSAYAFGLHSYDGEIEIFDKDEKAWTPPYRKVCLSTTHFLPMYVGQMMRATTGVRTLSHFYPDSTERRKSAVEANLIHWSMDKAALRILSLLSTLNFDWIVDGTEPGEEGQRVRVEPDVPFNSHSEIQINLPKEKGVELALEKFHRASPLGIRRHWVRAHNRVIRKDGVPVRVIRVSEHQRGDAKLGTVTHDYVLERQQKKKED